MLFFERVKVVLRKTKEEFFEISKNKQMTEKVFLTRITLSLVSIIVCILIMSVTAYTKQIGEFLSDGTAVIKNDRTITVRVAANQTVYVKITSHWGSCAITELVFDDATPIYADFGVPAESQSDSPRADGKPHSEETDSSNALFDD